MDLDSEYSKNNNGSITGETVDNLIYLNLFERNRNAL